MYVPCYEGLCFFKHDNEKTLQLPKCSRKLYYNFPFTIVLEASNEFCLYTFSFYSSKIVSGKTNGSFVNGRTLITYLQFILFTTYHKFEIAHISLVFRQFVSR